MSKKRILFVAENVTLAQVVRLSVLARALDPDRYEVHFACSEFPEFIFGGASFRTWPLRTVSAERAFARLEKGKPLYDEDTLRDYIDSDVEVLSRVRPALVVGDLRWSLAVSAPKSGVPHAALINAYWSPHAVRKAFPVPDHPIVRLLGLSTAEKYFPVAMPMVFRKFAAPLNRLRARHGLPSVGSLLELLTFGDYTLYADVPELVPLSVLSPTHRYLGPVLWSPGGELPPNWGTAPERPPLYVTLGSSGALHALPAILDGLDGLNVDVLVATAGRPPARVVGLRSNVHLEPYVPGDKACSRACLVITNGGSSTGYQALREGTPVLGVPHNLDQYLAMTAIVDAGAGELLRADGLTAAMVRDGVTRMLRSSSHRAAARRVGEDFARYDAAERFRSFVDWATSRPDAARPGAHGPASDRPA